MDKTWKIHPLCARYPDIPPGPEWDAFSESVCKKQLLPVYVWKEYIIDGKNRFRARDEKGLLSTVVDMTAKLKDEEEVEAFVRALNEHRRHLTKEQRRQYVAEKRAEGKTIQTIAEELNVPAHAVYRDIRHNEGQADAAEPKASAPRPRGRPKKEASETTPEPAANGTPPERIINAAGVERPATYQRKQKKPPKASKAGREKDLHDYLGKAVRAVVALREGEPSNRYYEGIQRSIQDALNLFHAMRKAAV